jgi:hypothetical protein
MVRFILKLVTNEACEYCLELAPLAASSFTFIFPFLDSVISKGKKQRNVEHVLSAADLLMQHCALEETWIPRNGMCDLLISLMETFPRLEGNATANI